MGMAASQARLLTITARIHDVESQAQSIQNAKIQLSTQSDQVYQKYLDALDATTLTVKNSNGEKIVANFNNLCGKNAVETGEKYALRTSRGQLIVSDEIKDGYDEFMYSVGENNPQAFALFMMDENGYTENNNNTNTNIGSSIIDKFDKVDFDKVDFDKVEYDKINIANGDINKVLTSVSVLSTAKKLQLQGANVSAEASQVLAQRNNLVANVQFADLSVKAQEEYLTLTAVSNAITKADLEMVNILDGRKFEELSTTEAKKYNSLQTSKLQLVATQGKLQNLISLGTLSSEQEQEVDKLTANRYNLITNILDSGDFMSNLEKAENKVANNHLDNQMLQSLSDSMITLLNGRDYNDLTDEEKDKYDELEFAYRNQLYNSYAEEIYTEISGDDDFDYEEFSYYVSIFNQIQAAGGNCVSISDYDGTSGDAASDSDWLTNMIECGKITIEIVNTDSKTGLVSFDTTSPTSDTYVDYTETASIDKKALAKAEAEYEHELKQIDQKDKKYDMDLSKLETERTALTTEYESVKKVINDNIERTFGIFS